MTQSIGILHPGAMGSAVAKTMVNSGYEVLWVSTGRSEASRQRAEAAGLVGVETLTELCQRCAAIVSVCPPHAAADVAEGVIEAGFQGLYLDGNAISPQKTNRIGQAITEAGGTYVDGGIIGGPPVERDTTWLYVSGPQAEKTTAFFAAGPLECEVISDEIGKASALKMCFAAHTKGTTALLSAILGGAELMNVRGDLERQWSRHGSTFAIDTQRRVQGTAHQRAWRFKGEMEEMVETFASIGLPAGFFEAATEVYRRLSHFKDAPETPDILQIVEALAQEEKR